MIFYLFSTLLPRFFPSVDFIAFPLDFAAALLFLLSLRFLLSSMTLLKKSLEFRVEVVRRVAGLAVEFGSDIVS